jgi:anthranilate synthase component I
MSFCQLMLSDYLQPSFPDFCALAEQGNLVPVSAELTADYETPLSAFQKIDDGNCSFLFESAEMHSTSGRYSLLGSSPRLIFTAHGTQITLQQGANTQSYEIVGDPSRELERILGQYKPASPGKHGVFNGGAVGYMAYDMVRFFEPTLPPPPPDALGLPDMVFYVTETVLCFDHKTRKLTVTANVCLQDHPTTEAAYDWARAAISRVVDQLSQPLATKPLQAIPPGAATVVKPQGNTTQQEYEQMVRDGKEFIAAGDIFQFVPSQRFEANYDAGPVPLYRALRHVNPSPYMFCMRFPQGFCLVGSSPEVHVKCIGGRIDIRPIAGTRWRGKTEAEDLALEKELLADPKERAEHLMLIDLARNDVGRVAEYGSVLVDDLMIIERYSHVMHIVSNVQGRLNPQHSSFDVMRATFPAGTVSGSPKVRAMEIINSLEKNKRCAYAGAVGYFGFNGDLDSCIALRTCVLKDGKAYVQAGAGVVADSDPTAEHNETVNKAMGMLRAIAWAEKLA